MTPAVELEGVTVFRRGAATRTRALADVTWTVRRGEHWAVAGPNAAGKSTLVRIAAARLFPSRGRAAVLGETFGRTRMAALRERIGLVDASLTREFYPHQTVLDAVVAGTRGVVLLREAPERDVVAARETLARFGVGELAERRVGECSEGERMRIMLARVFAGRPELLVLDEPAAGLDLPGREAMLAALRRVVAGDRALTTITVSHHLEELPSSTTHALLLREGSVVAAGPAAETLADAPLSECFGIPVAVARADGRYFVHLAGT